MPQEHVVSIDPSKPLSQEPGTGHNRWHEAIEPVLEVDQGDLVVFETRDAFDGQLNGQSTEADVGQLNLNVVHPLTGPVYVKGAEPGDLLEVKLVDIEADPWEQWGYTIEVPGFGFLRDEFPDPFIVHWRLYGDEYAESDQLPGVRIRYNPHPGTFGLAPGAQLRQRAAEREAELAEREGFVLPPEPTDAVRAEDTIAQEGLRTIPPRETAGNIDIKQFSPGATMLIPVYAEGALVSTGDVHYAQGDCEACGTAIEMRSRVHVRFQVRKGEAEQQGIRDLQFFRDDYFTAPELAVPRRFFATTGTSIRRDGQNESEDLTLAARNALLNMIEHLQTRGFTRQQAYALCSVAVDLRINQTVDVPNLLVSALLPLDIFL
ncbi:MAG TPA: acetamidase/formamidase family protein [Rubrobacteraceae bacterium]|jgi:formamidase|nr:acetamidase/formamidase family protein [Rubrobacteraceae bacterium]